MHTGEGGGGGEITWIEAVKDKRGVEVGGHRRGKGQDEKWIEAIKYEKGVEVW